MKMLRKLLLLNWHYVIKEVIEFDTINFMTGKTAMGKSTIIDAMQLLFLADTSGTFFNKAANDKSIRTLKGYLKCDISEDDIKGILYLRNNDFSSYIVAEIEDTETHKSFCIGVVFDVYEAGDHKHLWFHFDDTLPENHFIIDQSPINIPQLKEWLNAKYEISQRSYVETGKTFRETLKRKFGSLNDKFFLLFKKAVPFSPELNIKAFIAEFLVEAKHKIEILGMRDNIHHYKQMEQYAELVRFRCLALKEIETKFANYENKKQLYNFHNFVMDRATIESQKLLLKTHQTNMEAQQNTLIQTETRCHMLDAQLAEKQTKVLALVEEKATSKEENKLKELNQQKDEIQLEISAANDAGDKIKQIIKSYILPLKQAYQDIVNYFSTDSFIKTIGLSINNTASNFLAAADNNDYSQIEPEMLSEWEYLINQELQPYFQMINQDFKSKKNELEKEKGRLTSDLEGLKKGIKPYPDKLLELQNIISIELSNKYGRLITPKIFCEMLDIKDQIWRNAIEGYLNTQKFYLILPGEFYTDAVKIYKQLAHQKGLYEWGIVDIEKLMRLNLTIDAGSLAEEILTDQPYARAYANYLLGRVMKAQNVDDFKRFRTAITQSCMLYKNFVSRQIDPRQYQTPYIGKKAIEDQIKQKETRLKEVETLLTQYDSIMGKINYWIRISVFDQNQIKYFSEHKSRFMKRSELEIKRQLIIQEISAIDLSYLTSLEEQIRALNQEINHLDQENKKLLQKIGELKNSIKNLTEIDIPNCQFQLNTFQEQLTINFGEEWINTTGEPRFLKLLEQYIKPDVILNNFNSAKAQSHKNMNEEWDGLIHLRDKYNRDNKLSLEILNPSNQEFEEEYLQLSNTFLPEYEEKIRDAKQRAYIQFQEDFIHNLHENIKAVEEQVVALNDALKEVPFGRVHYSFHCSPSTQYRDYYNMINDEMLLEGYNLFSPSFQTKYEDTINRLFNQIISTVESTLSHDKQKELEENLMKFTDFRTYLDFDLMVIDEMNRENRLSKRIGKSSGGETQNPFYIAVLASFVQLYRIKRNDNTLRLIIFDEAYNKMDHERIQESIKLIKNLGLQVVLAAPTEKIPDIAPLVDRNQIVMRVNNRTFVKEFDINKEFLKKEDN